MMTNARPHVVIVGGGIAGLSTAFALHEAFLKADRPLACTIVEAQETWGGKIVTHRVGGLLIEGGPDSFLTSKPWGLDLCEKLGLSHQLINTNEVSSKTFIYSRGKLREFPQGLVAFVPTQIGPLFRSGLLSWPGIVRMAADWFLPARSESDEDESLASFFRRRLGREAFDRFIEPLAAGIYAGDADELSLAATFPRFIELERQYGGLIKGMLAQRNAVKSPGPKAQPHRTMFTTLSGGLGDLVSTLVERVKGSGTTLLTGQHVVELKVRSDQHTRQEYDVVLENGSILQADSVVLATPAYVSAKLVQPLSRGAADLLDTIPYASTATISLAFRRSDVESVLQGFGFVVPKVEKRTLLAATWTSLKWSNRAQPGESLIRGYIGGRGREANIDSDDASLVQQVRDELKTIVDIQSPHLYAEVSRWERGMPQYTRGHLERLRRIREEISRYPGLYMTGAAYEGVGIPDCIREGSRCADDLARYLRNESF